MTDRGKWRAAQWAPRLPWTCGAGMRPVCGIGLLLMAWMLAGALSGAQSTGESIDCTECHVCDRPAKLDPCLRSAFTKLCPRTWNAQHWGLSPGR